MAELLAEAKVEQREALVAGEALRLWPHRHQTDGFFAAAWRRTLSDRDLTLRNGSGPDRGQGGRT